MSGCESTVCQLLVQCMAFSQAVGPSASKQTEAGYLPGSNKQQHYNLARKQSKKKQSHPTARMQATLHMHARQAVRSAQRLGQRLPPWHVFWPDIGDPRAVCSRLLAWTPLAALSQGPVATNGGTNGDTLKPFRMAKKVLSRLALL
jgi:hypothetical protein